MFDKNEVKVVQVVRLDSDDVRNFCIANRYYTKGDCIDYGKMLRSIEDRNIKKDMIFDIAVDIAEHSDLSALYMDGYNMFEIVEHIMYGLGRIARTHYTIINK